LRRPYWWRSRYRLRFHGWLTSLFLDCICISRRLRLSRIYNPCRLCLYLRFSQTGQPALNYRALRKQALSTGYILCDCRGRWYGNRRADRSGLLPLRQLEASRRSSGPIACCVCGWHRCGAEFVYVEKRDCRCVGPDIWALFEFRLPVVS
jgi:hypothetical protein